MIHIVVDNKLREYSANVNLVMTGSGEDLEFCRIDVTPPEAIAVLYGLSNMTEIILLQDENYRTTRDLTGELRLDGVPAGRVAIYSRWLKIR